MAPTCKINGSKIATPTTFELPLLNQNGRKKNKKEKVISPTLLSSSSLFSSSMAMISTTNLPLTHLSTPSQKPISLSSSLFPSPSPLRLSSTTHFSHLFLHRKQPIHATPTTLTVKSMAPPKPGGKPKKGICYFLQFPLLGYSLFSSNSF